MLRNKLERYVAKRVLILSVILTILDVMFIPHPLAGFLGLLLGNMLGLVKFSFAISLLTRLFTRQSLIGLSKTVILFFCAAFVAALIILAVAAAVNMVFFAGVATGILLVPFVIFLLGLAKGLGISKLDLTKLLQ